MEEDPSAPRLFDDPDELLDQPPNTSPAEARFLEHEQGGSFGGPVEEFPQPESTPDITLPPQIPFGEAKTSLQKISEDQFKRIRHLTRKRLIDVLTQGQSDDPEARNAVANRAARAYNPEQFDKVFGDICEEIYGQRFTPIDIPVEWEEYRVVKDNYESSVMRGTGTYIRKAIEMGKMSEHGAGSSFAPQMDAQSKKFIGVDLQHAIALSKVLKYSDLPENFSWKQWKELSDDQRAYYLERYLRFSI
jgi:hypothetical protein